MNRERNEFDSALSDHRWKSSISFPGFAKTKDRASESLKEEERTFFVAGPG